MFTPRFGPYAGRPMFQITLSNARTLTMLVRQISTRFGCPHQSVGCLGFERQNGSEENARAAEQQLDCDANLAILRDHDTVLWDEIPEEIWDTDSVWYV